MDCDNIERKQIKLDDTTKRIYEKIRSVYDKYEIKADTHEIKEDVFRKIYSEFGASDRFIDEIVEYANNEHEKKQESKTFNSSGTHTIKYRACSSSGSCSAYSDSYTIKIDKDPPTCGDPSGGSTKWSKANYRTVAVACKKDTGGSGCAANKVSKKVTDECQTKNVTIKIKDNAGNETSCKNKYDIYLDRTPPTFVEKKQDITSNGWRHWRSVWKDNKSGLSTVNNGNYSKVYYCYGTQSNCSRRCTTSSHDSNTHKGTDGYYYRKANVDDNFVDGTTKGDRISFGTDNGCQSGKYLVRGDFHICDKANNCTDKHLKYDFR